MFFLLLQKTEKEKHTPGPGKYYCYNRRKKGEVHTTRRFFFKTKKVEKHPPGPGMYKYYYRRKKKRSTHQYQVGIIVIKERKKGEANTTRPVFFFSEDRRIETNTRTK
jgi:hypothetical protein